MAASAQYVWTVDKTEKLIEQIELRPVFYDTSSKVYSNRDARRAACDELAKQFDTTGT